MATKVDYLRWCLNKFCRSCSTRLPMKIHSYEHPDGYEVEGHEARLWLYVECKHCGQEWSLQKLGVPNEPLKVKEAA